MKKVSVITVNFNQPLITEQFLASVSSLNTYANIEVIVVDNGSRINPVPEWSVKYSGIQFIRSEINLGFAGGNNLAIQQAGGDYYFLVNNDTEFTEELVEKLAGVLDTHPDIGMISPKIRYFDQPDIIQYAGFTPISMNTGRNRSIGKFEKDTGQYDHYTGPTGYIHGAAMMIRKEAAQQAGLMAENFFLYYEEMDWCERVKACGYEIWIEPRALIYHKESVSVGRASPLKEYFMTRNRILFIRKHASLFSGILFGLYFTLIVTPRNLLRYLFNNRIDLTVQFIKGACWNLTHRTDSTTLGYPVRKIE